MVAGKKDGRLTQYKPDLKEAKTVAAPPGNPVSYLSVLWVSTYQFLVDRGEVIIQGLPHCAVHNI